MVWDEEKGRRASASTSVVQQQQHGEPEEIITSAPQRPQRPLTTAEKLEATQIDVASRGSSSDRDENCQDASKPSGSNAISRFLNRMLELEAALDRKLGVESQAIVRKLPEEREPVSWHSQLTMALLWASGTMNISCFATGFIGWDMGLKLYQSVLIVIFASLLGGAVSGFCATLGPATGLRQISIGRYSMGWYPNKLVALLNTIQQLGWSAVGCITGGLALQAVSDGRISIAVGIVIIAFCSLAISFIGLRAILVYEKYAWLVYLIIFMIIFGETGKYANNLAPELPPPGPEFLSGANVSAAVLSLLAIVYGSSASWATIASDYYAHYPVDISRTKVFIMTTLGISVPTSIGMIAGCVVSSTLNTQTAWMETYTDPDRGLGFLIQDMLYPRGFAKFLLVLLVLSGINMNILNTYSAAISCQQFARPLARVPRIFWTVLCFGVIIALALAGRNQLLTYLENFLSLLGYWCTSYFVIVFTEHYLFRKGNFANYNLEAWNDPKRLPLGIAAGSAFALGVVAWIMGMVQTWYVGPLSGLIGEGGGDIGNEFTFVVTALSYVPLRYWELTKFGR